MIRSKALDQSLNQPHSEFVFTTVSELKNKLQSQLNGIMQQPIKVLTSQHKNQLIAVIRYFLFKGAAALQREVNPTYWGLFSAHTNSCLEGSASPLCSLSGLISASCDWQGAVMRLQQCVKRCSESCSFSNTTGLTEMPDWSLYWSEVRSML